MASETAVNSTILNGLYAALVPTDEKVTFWKIDPETKEKTDPFTTTDSYKLFLVNEGKLDIVRMDLRAGGFCEDTQLNETRKRLKSLPPEHFLYLWELDYQILDFVLWYELNLHLKDGSIIPAVFRILKATDITDQRLFNSRVLRDKIYRFNFEPQEK